jgi:hypothetical protein
MTRDRKDKKELTKHQKEVRIMASLVAEVLGWAAFLTWLFGEINTGVICYVIFMLGLLLFSSTALFMD